MQYFNLQGKLDLTHPRRRYLTAALFGVVLAAAFHAGPPFAWALQPETDPDCQTWVNLSFRDETLENVLATLSQLTEMEVLIEQDARRERVTVELEGVSVPQGLGQILDSIGLSFAMVVDPSDPCRVRKIYIVGRKGGTPRPLELRDDEGVAADTSGDEVTAPGSANSGSQVSAARTRRPVQRTEAPRTDERESGVPVGEVARPHSEEPEPDFEPDSEGVEPDSPSPSDSSSAEEGNPPEEIDSEPSDPEEPPSDSEEPASDFEEPPSSEEPEALPEELEEHRAPPSPDPMNLYRYFTGDTRTRMYHRLSCRDAMTTPASSKVWFESEEQAQSVGFSPHPCVAQPLPGVRQ